MKHFLFILTFLVFCMNCNQRQQTSVNTETAKADTLSTSLDVFMDSLSYYPTEAASSMRGLELFRKYFSNRKPEDCDRTLKTYLEFQAKLMDSLNIELTKRPDYEKINSLIYADSKLHEPEGKQYEKQLKQAGLIFKSTEGIIYIDRDPDLIKTYFFDFLTPPTKEFLTQFIEEEKQELSEDGGLIISPKDLADRLAFWDDFCSKYPDHIFKEFAQNNKKDYLFFLMAGMDNTPVFSHEDKKIYPEFLEAYNSMTTKYPTLASSKVIAEYVELLKVNGFFKTEKVEQFIKKYSIY